jgi:protein-tyrosine phosphatase
MGRVDLHNHILYGLDDGATDVAESMALARELVAAGFTDVAATPHSKPGMDPSSDTVATRRQELQDRFDREGIPLRLHAGCENHLTPEFLARVEAKEPRALGNGPYVLVELPFASPVSGLREHLFRIMLRGLRPILAHPERCAQFVGRMSAAQEAFDAGAQFQIEIGSLGGIYGGPARKTAQAMLDAGLVALAATDAHHLRSTQEILGSGLKAFSKALGTTRLQLLTEENPARVLRGEPLLGS